MEIQPQQTDKAYGLLKQYIATQPTIPVPTVGPISQPTDPEISLVNTAISETKQPRKKLRGIRLLAMALSILVAIILFFTWHMFSQQATTTGISPQTFTTSAYGSPTNQIVHATPAENSGSDIQVYIVGAVKHPGVYTLSGTARVYQLLQAAGGPLTSANLVALNLAAKLSDGQEIYVAAIGETTSAAPSASIPGSTGSTISALPSGQLVNINSATADSMRQNLHLATTTAQNIVTYRLNHGNFTSVDQLLQVVSKNIYNKIKGQVTLS